LNSLGTISTFIAQPQTRYYYQNYVKGDKNEVAYFETGKDSRWKAGFITPHSQDF